MKIADYTLNTPLALAPMAGISDKPFRILCKKLGASWTPSEMTHTNANLENTFKTQTRKNFAGESSPLVLQIVGSEPEDMALSAIQAEELGADFIDINMGCPAKKVCKKLAGSALMQDEAKVQKILTKVVEAVKIPVTLKTRLGWNDENLNVLKIAKIAEDSGIAAIAIHGRSRTQMFGGEVNYKMIGEVKKSIKIPVWANGDIHSLTKAKQVLELTKADGLMIGRGACGNPWLFAQIKAFMQGSKLLDFTWKNKGELVLQHLKEIYAFYGEFHGVRIARKHIRFYLTSNFNSNSNLTNFLKTVNKLETSSLQLEAIAEFWQKNPTD